MKDYRLEVFRRASLCRNFEEATFKYVKNNLIQLPVYLSAGQEYIPSSISSITGNEYNPNIFIQHRGHSTYLAFGGNVIELIDELLGRKTEFLEMTSEQMCERAMKEGFIRVIEIKDNEIGDIISKTHECITRKL